MEISLERREVGSMRRNFALKWRKRENEREETKLVGWIEKLRERFGDRDIISDGKINTYLSIPLLWVPLSSPR